MSIRGIYTNNPSTNFEYRQTFKTIGTKRYIHGVLGNRIKRWVTADKLSKSVYHAVALSGVRRIGKTTVMYQLYNKLNGVLYIDGAVFKGDIWFVLAKQITDEIRYIFIDEICKMSDDNISAISEYIKTGTDDKFFILTGSIAENVIHIASRIADCAIIEMQPIMYIERLAWKHGVSLKESLRYTDYADFINWVRHGELKGRSISDYIQGVVADTLDSYTMQSNCSKFNLMYKDGEIHQDETRVLFQYVVLCQLIYLSEFSGTFINIDHIDVATNSSEVLHQINDLRKSINILKSRLKKETIKAFCEMLEKAGLISRVFLYSEKDNERLRQLEKEYGVSAYLFEYPQMISVVLGEVIDGVTLNACIEYTILAKANHYFYNVGKYRTSEGSSEVDIVYTIEAHDFANIYVIEVKNSLERNTHIGKYANISLEGIKEFALTSSDQIYREIEFTSNNSLAVEYISKFNKAFRIRNDIVVLLLELGFIEKSYKQDRNSVGTTKSLGELYKKYEGYLS